MTRQVGADAPRRLFGLLFLAATLLSARPLLVTRYLPIEDLPQHLAAIRVLHSFRDSNFGFERYFQLDLLRTQYLAYYTLGHLLAYVFELELANRLIIVACVIATPYAMRYLLESLRRPAWLALFVLPLTYNAHLVLGFINFLMAIPAALFGLGVCVRLTAAWTWSRAFALAGIALLCFFCHVVPFAFLLLGCGLLALDLQAGAVVRRLTPLAPAGLVAVMWLLASPAGQATLTAAHGGKGGPQPVYQPVSFALRDLPNWLTDVLQGDADEQVLKGLLGVLAATLILGVLGALLRIHNVASGRPPGPAADGGEVSPRAFLRLLPLAPLAALLYFITPSAYDWIWPIAQRFPLLALIFVIPVLPAPPRAAAFVLALALCALVFREQQIVAQAFRSFEQDEVGDFDAALESIPPGSRVLGLIWSRGSGHVKFSPFIHFVAYYQARKGGAVMFSFADFPQSPFRFREEDRPPRVPPRWEWLPQRVRPIDMSWYEYVLVRSGPAPCGAGCKLLFKDALWSVWQRPGS
jgi:hypothetical protein